MSITLHVLIVIFLATLIQSAFGFGSAAVAVPLLSLRLPIHMAAPLVVLTSIMTGAIIVAQDWRIVHRQSVFWLLLSTLFGVPLGLWLLTHGNHHWIKAALGSILIAFSIYCLWGRWQIHLKSDSRIWLLGCGFCAGILGGAYGMNGPPLVVYGVARRWSAQHFRATFQGYFLPAGIVIMAGYWLQGLWVWDITYYWLVSLPAALVAIFLGRILNRRLHTSAFQRYVYIGLIVIGAALLVQATRG